MKDLLTLPETSSQLCGTDCGCCCGAGPILYKVYDAAFYALAAETGSTTGIPAGTYCADDST